MIEKRVDQLIEQYREAKKEKKLVKAVYLKYGSFASIRMKDKDNKKLTEKEKQYATQAKYFIERMTQGTQNQGETFISSNDCLEGGL